jgi:hypothetical protein
MAEERERKSFIEEYLSRMGMPAGFEIFPLAGDASNRQYFRVRFGGRGGSTAILMHRQKSEGFKKSEEAVSKAGQGPPEDPFILVDRFLKKSGLPVPVLYHAREDGSLLLQEDFGDQTLFSHLSGHPGDEEKLTGSVLALLVDLQRLSWVGKMDWIEDRRFSADLIRWEFDHFLEYGLIPGTYSVREEIDRESKFLSGSFPPVLVHRDYHSRNLMVREDGMLGLIDFQDLLIGSPFYDLASFLFDAYRVLPMESIERWSRFHYDLATSAGILPRKTSWEDSFRVLTHHAYQRNMKACGRFFYIADVKGNPSFLASVSGTHQNMDRLAEMVPELGKMHEKIRPHLRLPAAR